jgi:hypothetical protein
MKEPAMCSACLLLLGEMDATSLTAVSIKMYTAYCPSLAVLLPVLISSWPVPKQGQVMERMSNSFCDFTSLLSANSGNKIRMQLCEQVKI